VEGINLHKSTGGTRKDHTHIYGQTHHGDVLDTTNKTNQGGQAMGGIELLTPEQVADILKVSVNTIYKKCAPGYKEEEKKGKKGKTPELVDPFPHRIKPRRVGRCLRFRSDEVQEYIESL